MHGQANLLRGGHQSQAFPIPNSPSEHAECPRIRALRMERRPARIVCPHGRDQTLVDSFKPECTRMWLPGAFSYEARFALREAALRINLSRSAVSSYFRGSTGPAPRLPSTRMATMKSRVEMSVYSRIQCYCSTWLIFIQAVQRR